MSLKIYYMNELRCYLLNCHATLVNLTKFYVIAQMIEVQVTPEAKASLTYSSKGRHLPSRPCLLSIMASYQPLIYAPQRRPLNPATLCRMRAAASEGAARDGINR